MCIETANQFINVDKTKIFWELRVANIVEIYETDFNSTLFY